MLMRQVVHQINIYLQMIRWTMPILLLSTRFMQSWNSGTSTYGAVSLMWFEVFYKQVRRFRNPTDLVIEKLFPLW